MVQVRNSIRRPRSIQNNTTISRSALANSVNGINFDGKRDLYQSCGYPTSIDFAKYKNAFNRGDIGKTIISIMPEETWFPQPLVLEEDETKATDSAFLKEWKALVKKMNVFGALEKVDILSGIGRWGVLFLGFDDGKDIDKEVKGAKNLLYMRSFTEEHAQIASWESDKSSPRYGKPNSYTISFGNDNEELGENVISSIHQNSKTVHHSRVIHVAENSGENEVYGVPRLKVIFNRLLDCWKLLGCSPEMFWQGAFRGLAFLAEADATMPNQDITEAAIQKYVHGLQRYITMQGFDIKELSPSIADPTPHVKIQLSIIAAVERIPLRILIGSEAGELSSSQDAKAWKERVAKRQSLYNGPGILVPFIDKLVEVGVLPSPSSEEGYMISWPDKFSPGTKEQADIAKIVAQALKEYTLSGIDAIIPPEIFLKDVIGLRPGIVDKAMQATKKMQTREDDEEGLADEEFRKRQSYRTDVASGKTAKDVVDQGQEKDSVKKVL